jgi:hypothetical protein
MTSAFTSVARREVERVAESTRLRSVLGVVVFVAFIGVAVVAFGLVVKWGTADAQRTKRTQATPALTATVVDVRQYGKDENESWSYSLDVVDPATGKSTRVQIREGKRTKAVAGGSKEKIRIDPQDRTYAEWADKSVPSVVETYALAGGVSLVVLFIGLYAAVHAAFPDKKKDPA